ncbi:MAG: DUF4266 domain-containing protein [Magnetococcales bacterium]|nr:DUF4266 domain-containing protein [Magnetococcales bacterium]NGZ06238.1 DUF4266 domain-containing protein [Magnetococcales bacterium]
MSRLLLLTISGVLLAGCASDVKAWEKGILAQPHMQPGGGNSIQAVHEHVYTSKEGSFGGTGIGGGGCGCN